MINEQLQHKRHTLAHLLAVAVKQIWPGSQNAIGPAIEDGFYQDFEIAGTVTDEDLPKIEQKMRELLPSWTGFEKKEVTKEEALEEFAWNTYKTELINEFAAGGKAITFHNAPGLVDLCKGGHVDNPAKEIAPDSFKLTHIAGAYWRGSEKNKMLTRIYGLAFDTKAELDTHLAMLEEAKKRDHKVLGPKLDLFVFSDLVGAGLPLWTPKGTLLRILLDDFVWQLRKAKGYDRVEIPHINRRELYETSGHWDKYQGDLFKIKTREGHEFAMKPMNCPHHTQIYARKQWSYRELPQRYANTTMVYRDEQSGELAGLARVRSITQDDAHVFCRMDQVKAEGFKIWDIIQDFYGAFGIPLRVRLSLRDPRTPEKYLGNSKRWDATEDMLREMVVERGVVAEDGIGEAAFYAPKLDFMGRDAIGREHQVATIQMDMSMPERFDLFCINDSGEHERIVMIHAAIMGSIERFLALAIEHFAGAFPLWLAPTQVKLVSVADRHADYTQIVAEKMRAVGLRVEIDLSNEKLGKKIRESEMMKVPYLVILGDKEIEAKKISVRKRGGEDLGMQDPMQFIEKLKDEIEKKQL